jgi:hypothetical protein
MQIQKLAGYSLMILGAARVAAGFVVFGMTDSDTLETAALTAALISHGAFGLFSGAYTAGSYSQLAVQGFSGIELISSAVYTVTIAGGINEPWAWWGLTSCVWYIGIIIASAAHPIRKPIKLASDINYTEI